MNLNTAQIANAEAIGLSDIPLIDKRELTETIVSLCGHSHYVNAFFGAELNGQIRIFAALGDPSSGLFDVFSTSVKNGEWESITPECPQLHMFER